MNLFCKRDHMRGLSVSIEGRRYQIGLDNIAYDVSAEDAQHLLQNPEGWCIARSPVAPGAPVAAPEAAPVRRIGLIADTGEVLERPKAPEPVAPPVATPPAPQPAPLMPPAPPPLIVTQAEQLPAPEPEILKAEVPAQVEAPANEGPDVDKAKDWPDPDESMDIEYLRKMAQAWDVGWTHRTAKRTLVGKIMKAMYGDDAEGEVAEDEEETKPLR